MFCPECKAEYRGGFTKCGDCGIELVDVYVEQEPEQGDADSKKILLNVENPVEISGFLHAHQAEFAISVLDGSGIKAYIAHAFTGHIASYFMLGTGGIRLVVGGQDRERALEILRSSEELNQHEMADQEDDR